jgi:histone H4
MSSSSQTVTNNKAVVKQALAAATAAGRSSGKAAAALGAVRHRAVAYSQLDIMAMKKPVIKKLVRRGGGSINISTGVYEEVRALARSYLEELLREAVDVTQGSRRKMITLRTIGFLLARRQTALYGEA